MKCSVVTTTTPDAVAALDGLCDQVLQELDGRRPDLVFLFFTTHHAADVEDLRDKVDARLQPGVLLGCPSSGVIGDGVEIESQSGLVLWAAAWPGVDLTPFQLEIDDGTAEPELTGWPKAAAGGTVIVLPDPYSIPGDGLLRGLEHAVPEAVVVGGMSSGNAGPGRAHLIGPEGVQDEGAVGVVIGPGVEVTTVVSQGCRAVGQHFVITKAEGNVIHSLGGKPALEQLQLVGQAVSPHDRAMMQSGLHVGRVVDERKSTFSREDFLVRNIIHIDPSDGSIAIADYVRPGQTIQFMVRDATSASEELEALMAGARDDERPALGALVFSCNGRGSRFFAVEHHDALGVRAAVQCPTAGFFAAGEIGPVGGQAFLHGLTASIAVFRPARED